MERPKLIKVSVSIAAILIAGTILTIQLTAPAPGEVIVKGPAAKAPPDAKAPAPQIKREGGGRVAPGGG